MSRFKPKVRWWSATTRLLPQFAPAQRPQSRRRLMLERLEDRTMLSMISIPVTSLADSGAGTLRAAITQANSGPATNNYVIPIKVNGTIDLLSHLPDLNNNIDIMGPGSSLLTIANGFSVSYNWPIFGTGSTATVLTINISGLSFTNGYNDFGGDIENTSSIMMISNCTFENSIAAFGGAISTNVSITIIHCDFYNNGADWGGGAIFISNFDATVTVIDSSFEHNAANTPNPGYGGAIYNQGTELILIGDTFKYNSAVDGGAIYNDDWSFNINGVASYSTVNVIGCTFDSNYAYTNAGGLDNDGTAMVIGSTFTGNYATVDGGGIINESGGMLTVIGSTFTGNYATDGGGIYNLGTLIVIGSVFSNNTGGDIYP